METINNRWVELTKAYKALTDEDIRNNYLMYGNPDGRQNMSMGIALPKFIVMQGNGKYVLLFYGLLLGVVLPYAVGRWWYGTQALTKDKVLVASAGNLFKEYKDDLTESGVLAALSTGEDFRDVLKGAKADSGAAKVEKIALSLSALPEDGRSIIKKIDDPVRRKVLCLLWAYLCRADLEDPTLQSEKIQVAPEAVRLNNSMTSITLPFGTVPPLLATYHVSQSLIQAVPPGASPMMQLPHFTPSLIRSIQGAHSKDRLTVQKFMALHPQIRRSLVSGLTDVEYTTAMQAAADMPYLRLAKAFFKVTGEKVVTPSSLVQLVIKARFIPPGTTEPEVNELDLEDMDPDDDDVAAHAGRRAPKNRRRKTVEGEPVEEESTQISFQAPLAFAPYYGREHSPRWHVFLQDARSNRIAVPPFTFAAFDRPIFDSEGRPTFNMQTLKCQFQAPPSVGQYAFVMHLICDCYIGFDTKMDIILNVEDVSKAEKVQSDDEISEPDEGNAEMNSHDPVRIGMLTTWQIHLLDRCRRSKRVPRRRRHPRSGPQRRRVMRRAIQRVVVGRI